jgi:hypothetical protein
MPALRPVAVNLEKCLVDFGETEVVLRREGEIFVTPDGLRLHPVTFAQRSDAVAAALTDLDQPQRLLTELRRIAITGESNQLADALMLALAGGGEDSGAFSECARAACRFGSLNWNAVQQMPALLVDQLVAKVREDAEDGWTRFEFQPPTAEAGIDEHCCQMVDRLLARGMPVEPPMKVAGATAPAAPLRARTRSSQTVWDEVEPASRASSPGQSLTSGVEEPAAKSILETQVAAPSKGVSNQMVATAAVPPVPNESTLEGATSAFDASEANTAQDWTGEASPTRIGSSGQVGSASGSVIPPASASVRPARVFFNRQASTVLERASNDKSIEHASVAVPATTGLEPFALATAAEVAPTKTGTAVRTMPRGDWLYELAIALAEECDLRGLDT